MKFWLIYFNKNCWFLHIFGNLEIERHEFVYIRKYGNNSFEDCFYCLWYTEVMQWQKICNYISMASKMSMKFEYKFTVVDCSEAVNLEISSQYTNKEWMYIWVWLWMNFCISLTIKNYILDWNIQFNMWILQHNFLRKHCNWFSI